MTPRSRFHKQDITKVAKGAGITFSGSIIGKGLFFLTNLLIASLLGAEAFGLYNLAFVTVKICEIISGMGLKAGGMKFTSLYRDSDFARLKGVLVSGSSLSILNGTIIGLILFWLSGSISDFVFHKPTLRPCLEWFSFSIPFTSGVAVVSGLLLGFQTTKYTVYVRDLIQPITNIILVLVFYSMGFGLNGVILSFFLSHCIALLSGLFYLNRLFKYRVKNAIKTKFDFRTIISCSLPLMFVGILSYLVTWTNVLMLGSLAHARDVGVYSAAAYLSLTMVVTIVASNSIYAPVVADLHNRGENHRFENILKATTRWISYITMPILLFLVFSAPELMAIFGAEYVDEGAFALVVLSLGQAINCLTGGVGATLNMTGRQNLELLNTFGTILVVVCLNILLIPLCGIRGAAISNAISLSLINLLRIFQIRVIYGIHPFSIDIGRYLLPSLFSAVVLFMLRLSLDGRLSTFQLMLLNFWVVFCVYFVYWAKKHSRMNDEDRYVLEKIRGKVL